MANDNYVTVAGIVVVFMCMLLFDIGKMIVEIIAQLANGCNVKYIQGVSEYDNRQRVDYKDALHRSEEDC